MENADKVYRMHAYSCIRSCQVNVVYRTANKVSPKGKCVVAHTETCTKWMHGLKYNSRGSSITRSCSCSTQMERGPVAKRAQLVAEEVLDELDEFDDEMSDFEFEDDGPLMEGSGDELEDLQSDEREKEMYEEGMTADEEREHNTEHIEGEKEEEEGDE